MMDTQTQKPRALLKAQKLAKLTDSSFKIPILGVSLGLDALIGLIPVVGDLLMVGVSLRIVSMAKQMQVPKTLRLKMLKNIALDFLFGLVPFVGDVIDLFYKSNKKNVRIMEKWWKQSNQLTHAGN
jgi:hypothetical protein